MVARVAVAQRSIRLQGKTATELNQLVGVSGEIFFDTTNQSLRIFPTGGTTSVTLSTKAYVDTQIASLVNGAPETLNTLAEIATALQNQTTSAALVASIAAKANTSALSAVAFSGNYNSLSNRPSIPLAQVSSDWNATTGVARILNKPAIPTFPSQTGNSGKYLTTNGTSLSWSTVSGGGGGDISGQDPWRLLFSNATGNLETNLCLSVQDSKNEMHSIAGYGNVGMNVQIGGSNLIINPRLDAGNPGTNRAVTGGLYFTRPVTDPAFGEAQNLKALNPTRRAAFIKYIGDNGGNEYTGALVVSPWYQGQRGFGGASSITIDDDFSDRNYDRALTIKRVRDFYTWGPVLPSDHLGTPNQQSAVRTTTYDFNGANGHQTVNISGTLSFASYPAEGAQYKSDVPEWSPGANRGYSYITIPALHTGSGLKWQGQISSNPKRIRDLSNNVPYVEADGIPFWSLGYKMSTQNIEDYPSIGIAQYDRIPDHHAISYDVRGRVSINEATLDETLNVLGSIKLQVSSATQNSHNGVVNLNWRPGRPQEGDEAQVGIYFADGTFQNTAATGESYITVQEEGTEVSTANTINFVGAGVTASEVNGVATVTISGGSGSGIDVKEEGTNVVAGAGAINFVGAGVTATNVSGVATITIPALVTQEEGSDVVTVTDKINFVGAGVTATNVSGVATVTIPGGIAGIAVKEEGTNVVASASAINFVGAGVTASDVSGVATITVASGLSGIAVQEEGTNVVSSASTINFVGAGVTASNVSGVATVTVSSGSSITVYDAGASSTVTLNYNNGQWQRYSPSSTYLNITVSNIPTGGEMTIILQTGATNTFINWTGVIFWEGGDSAPSASSGVRDIITIKNDGLYTFGKFSKNYITSSSIL